MWELVRGGVFIRPGPTQPNPTQPCALYYMLVVVVVVGLYHSKTMYVPTYVRVYA